MWADDSRLPIYGELGLQRRPSWRLALSWLALWRKARQPESDLRFLSDHLRRDIGLGSANERMEACEGRYPRCP